MLNGSAYNKQQTNQRSLDDDDAVHLLNHTNRLSVCVCVYSSLSLSPARSHKLAALASGRRVPRRARTAPSCVLLLLLQLQLQKTANVQIGN
jgi:hypothetical protein